jgi:hypothetical protein
LKNNSQHKALSFFMLFAFLYLSFSSVNFFTTRYLLCLMPMYAISMSYFMYTVFEKRWLYFLLFFASTTFFIYHSAIDRKSGETDLAYADIVKVQMGIVNFCEENKLYDKTIYDPFLNVVALKNKYASFLSQDKEFAKTTSIVSDSIQYAIVSNYQRGKKDSIITKSPDYLKLIRIQNGNSWSDIYKNTAH